MIEIYPEHTSIRRLPQNLKQSDIGLFQHEINKKINPTIVLKLRNVYLLADTIFKLKNLKFFLSYTHWSGVTLKTLIKRLLLLFRSHNKMISGVWITDEWSEGYFHWLTDALPRLFAVENVSKTNIVVLPKKLEAFEYIKESLKLLNYRAHFFEGALFVRELVLPSHTAPTGNYNNHFINSVRNRFLKSFETTRAFRKVFISRSKAAKRKINNEEEIINLLELYGYEIHYFEDYSFEKQIQIMSETKTLIGIHGAGLTNMLFMQEGGQVLELRNKNDIHNNCYFSLASELNHNYFYQQCEGNSQDTHMANLTVSAEEMTINLDFMERDSHLGTEASEKSIPQL
jgi:capsular polysaccharide biosynthesis protein